ncbi:LacI family DNA-binding transcriptional regulator [Corynebacterium caspium]|uniref:LacI family DNA-binding transcriptional regulator n=1 Tax=Corynebacterium caspium TaxID=234828 RepID=UPI00036D375E|nr:LacI family DNA-binding transcriptional regulator [Corynebacterium caspium]WKD58717.1 Catabolite control protein A [Corynebacterium caspium DSM 44850]
MRSRPTLEDIATAVGVSRTSVSNAYNHPEQLSPGLRRKIFTAAAELGYSGPDPKARSLRTQKAGAIGVVLTEHLSYAFEDAASVDFLAGMAEASYGTELALTLIPVGPETPGVDQSARVQRAVVDGFVVYSVAEGDPHLAAALNSGTPLVVCGQPGTTTGAPFVGIDDRTAIKPAAEALIAAGHTDIGILSIRLRSDTPFTGFVNSADLDRAQLHIQRDRIRGALDVFHQAGIHNLPIVASHINDAKSAHNAAAMLLDNHPELTAVLCTTDSMAFGVISVAKERGLSIPEDLSLTGFDGIARALNYGLTTVIQPNKRKGAAAGKLLQQLLDNPLSKIPARTILPTYFAPGTSITSPRIS